jgi:hypothetical protein
MLLYTAAKMAASSYKSKNGGSVKKVGDSALPPKGATGGKTTLQTDKDKKDSQNATFLRLAGWDEDRIKKVLAKPDHERGVRYLGNKRRRVVDLPTKTGKR